MKAMLVKNEKLVLSEVEKPSPKSGEILITGRVNGVFYEEEKSPKGFLARIFK